MKIAYHGALVLLVPNVGRKGIGVHLGSHLVKGGGKMGGFAFDSLSRDFVSIVKITNRPSHLSFYQKFLRIN